MGSCKEAIFINSELKYLQNEEIVAEEPRVISWQRISLLNRLTSMTRIKLKIDQGYNCKFIWSGNRSDNHISDN
eukprot:c16864_g1_i1 orf=168-389(+)